NLRSVPTPILNYDLPYTLTISGSQLTAFSIQRASINFEKSKDGSKPATLLNCLLSIDNITPIFINGTAKILLDENQYPPPPPKAAVTISGQISMTSGSSLVFSPPPTSTSPNAPYYLFNASTVILDENNNGISG